MKKKFRDGAPFFHCNTNKYTIRYFINKATVYKATVTVFYNTVIFFLERRKIYIWDRDSLISFPIQFFPIKKEFCPQRNFFDEF